jgi:LacI family transcriptional regulator
MTKPPPTPRHPAGVSIATVAQHAGVSIATVSRVMNGIANKASATTTERVRRAIADLGYRPVSVGRALRVRQSRLVALLVANLANPAMAAIAASVEEALRQEGLVMVVCDTNDRPEIQDEYLLEMRAQLVRATVFLGAVASPVLSAMTHDQEPLLFVNRRAPDDPNQPFIGIDNMRAGQEVAAFFATREIPVQGIIHGPQTSSATADRIAGFRAALAAHGQNLPDSRIRTLDSLDHVQIGYRTAAALVGTNRPPRCGLFCLSDLIAYGAHRALQEAGLRVPEDVVLVGFDDNPLNDWLVPWLTSVRVPYDRFGEAVVQSLHSIWSRQVTPPLLLQHRLVIRDGNTAPYQSNGSPT